MRQKRPRRPKKSGFSEDSVPYTGGSKPPAPTHVTVELAAGGRLVIPAPMRAALGMKIGDRLTVRLEGHELRIHTYEEGLRQAHELVGKYLPENAVDEFLRWRREEGARETKKLERWSRDE
jgi:bifunctional DNA-binding transcriptional regulator/antitoxin component of YhaV-PrlF toxin-antitoxin module